MTRVPLLALLLAACEPPPPADIAVVRNEHSKDFYNTWSIRGDVHNNFDHATNIGLRAVFTAENGDTTHTVVLRPKYTEPGEVASFQFSVTSDVANGATGYRLSPVVE